MKRIALLALVLIAGSCATFYELNYEFSQSFESGDMERAEHALVKSEKTMVKKARFLYLVNRGTVDFMVGDNEESNEFFEQAFIFGEDYQKDYGQIAASFLTNPNMIDYPGEVHEHLMVLYFKALNYIKMNDHEAALVECRRLNNRLYALSEKFKSDRKYKEDAFTHALMGLIYDSDRDYNNAFIAYRNAYNIYKEDYTAMFGLGAPEQLKQDLLRTAYQSGFYDLVENYEKEFGVRYVHQLPENGELVFFWHNGLSPVKDEWSVNFTTINDGSGVVTFVNEDYGFSFPFPYENNSEEGGGLENLSIFRVAFPKYVERKPRFSSAQLSAPMGDFKLQRAQDINAISFKVLNDRMLAEFSRSLLRAAIKKSIEHSVRQESEGWGAVVSVLNAATEKADTRNWQTLPHDIFYVRVPLNEGPNHIKLTVTDQYNASKSQTFTFQGGPGKTVFHTYQTLN